MNRKRRSWLRVSALALTMSLVAAACSDLEEALKGPDDFPESEMGTMAVAMGDVLDDYFVANAEGFESLEALGPMFATGFSIVPLVSTPAMASGGPKVMQSIMRLAQLSPQSITADAYGVRFLLYEISGSTPVTPLNEIGYLDVA